MLAPPFPLWAWLVFVGLVLALLFLDLFVFHRNAREVPFGEAMWLPGFWIAVSLAFGGFVWFLAPGGIRPVHAQNPLRGVRGGSIMSSSEVLSS